MLMVQTSLFDFAEETPKPSHGAAVVKGNFAKRKLVVDVANDDTVIEERAPGPRPHARAAKSRTTTFDQEFLRCENEVQRDALSALRALVAAGQPIPFRRGLPCVTAVAELINADPAQLYAGAQLGKMIIRLANELRPLQVKSAKLGAERSRKYSYIQTVRDTLDALPHGTAVPSRGNTVSYAGFAEQFLHVDRRKVTFNAQVKQEVRARLADGRLTLGEGRKLRISRLVRNGERAKLICVIEKYVADEIAIPADSMRSSRADIGRLQDEAGIFDPELRDGMSIDVKVCAALRAAVKEVGLRVEGEVLPEEETVSYGRLKTEGEEFAKAFYRAGHPDAEAGGMGETRFLANERSALNRYMRVHNREDEDSSEPDLCGLSGEASIEAGCTGNASDRGYRSAMNRWRERALQLADAKVGPQGFAEILSAAIRKSGLSVPKLVARCRETSRCGPGIGTYADVIYRFRSGQLVPTHLQVPLVTRLEHELGLAPSTLTRTLNVRQTGRNTSGRRDIKLSDGRVMPMVRYLRYLPADALIWSSDRLLSEVEAIECRHYGDQTVHKARQAAVRRNDCRNPIRIARSTASSPRSRPLRQRCSIQKW